MRSYYRLTIFILILTQIIIPFTLAAEDNLNLVVKLIQPPDNFSLTVTPSRTVRITWTKDPYADTTLIRRKVDSYPTSISDGTLVYNSTGSSYVDGGVTPGNTYYYRAWSYNATAKVYSQPTGDYIHIASGPLFDIKNIIILDSIIPTLNIVCTVQNKGDVSADITVNWELRREDNNELLDSGSDTFAVNAQDEVTYQIYPYTNFVGLCRITFTGANATASTTFITSREARPSPPPSYPSPPPSPPSAVDSDNDGLTDAQEEFYGTDPYNPDTDGDGYTDYTEIQKGTDPLDPESYPREIDYSLPIFLAGLFVVVVIVAMRKEKE